MTEHEESKPLSDAELLRYTSYHERFHKALRLNRAVAELEQLINASNREPTVAEQEQLSELRARRYPLILDPLEIDDCIKLSARRGWPIKLEEFRCKVSFSAFADLSGALDAELKAWWGKYNLPTLLESYELAKEACTTHDARLKLARRKINHAETRLAQLEHDDSELLHQLDPSNNLGEVRRTILCEIMGEVFSQLLQHVTQDLPESKAISETKNSELPEQKQPYDYELIRLNRTREADLHDLHIDSLIRAKRYENWWEMKDKEPFRLMQSGNGLQPFYYPRPYSEKYFWRFLYLVANTPFPDVKAALRNQFFGDKVDRDYVQGLILYAEHNCYLILEEAVVIADDQGVLAFENPHNGWPFGIYPEAVEKLSDSIFLGGDEFKQRAQLVREWCQEMAAEDQEQSSSELHSPDKQSPIAMMLPASEEFHSTPSLTLPAVDAKADIVEESVSIDFQFENLTSIECKILCTAVGLDNKKRTYKPARAWGLAEVLVYYDFAAKGRTSELVQALRKAFGIKMEDNYAPDNLNQARKGARIVTNEQLLLMKKISEESYETLRNKQSKPQITRSPKG